MGYHLKKAGISYKILHNNLYNDFRQDKKRFLKRIEAQKPKLIAFSVITGRQTKDSANFSMEIKKKFPDISIVWGGIHPTILPEQCIKQPYVDYVLEGEADTAIVSFINAFEKTGDFSKVPGCWWKENKTPMKPQVKSTKTAPENIGLDFSEIDVKKYIAKGNNALTVITSRGCPFDCQFCINKSLDNSTWRPFPLTHVFKTIDYFKANGMKYIHINDDNFYVDFERATKILAYANIPSFSEIRIETLLRPGCLQKLSDLKCKKLMSGAESCDNKILKSLHKNLTYEQMVTAATLLKEFPAIQPSWSFIVGMPIENYEDIQTTIKRKALLEKIVGKNIGPVGMYMPYPGSPLYQKALRLGFTPPESPLGWGSFERYNFFGRQEPPEHNAFPWTNTKEVWQLTQQTSIPKFSLNKVKFFLKKLLYN